MFGLNVLSWNASYKKGRYSPYIKKALFGGNIGHSAAELIIPITEENKKLLAEVNKNGKGHLVVYEETTLVPHHIDKEPFYAAEEVPCYRIYFSFWGDVKTKKTPEKHRMVNPITDKIDEGEGIPFEYNEKGKKIFKNDPNRFTPIKWNGLIGSTSGFFGIKTIQHLAGRSVQEIKLSKEKKIALKQIEKQKELILWHVKEITNALGNLKTTEEKQAYLASEDTRWKLENDGVESFDALKLKLGSMSAAIKELRYELEKLGVLFGSAPDTIISLPIDPEQQLLYRLDYKAILREMGRIANLTVPYHALKINCSKATIILMKAGLSDELKAKLKSAGFSMPRSNTFFETPQSVYEFSTVIERILIHADCGLPNAESQKFREFIVNVIQFFVELVAFLFQPSKTQQLINLRAEYEDSLAKSKDGLLQLDRELAESKISKKTHDEVHDSGVLLVSHYEAKINEVDDALQALGVSLEKGLVVNEEDKSHPTQKPKAG